MYKQIYPVIGDEKNLPFYVVGLGLESVQMATSTHKYFCHAQGRARS